MHPSKKSEMGSSSKNSKHTFLPPGALTRQRGQSFRFMDSVRVSTEMRTLINQFKVMQETPRSKSAYDLSELAKKTNLLPPSFDPTKDDVTFSHDEYKVVNNTLKRKSAGGRAQSFTSVSSIRGSAKKRCLDEKSKGRKNATYDLSELAKKNNLVPPSFDPMEDDVTFPHDEYEVVNDTLKRKSGSEIQRTSIEKSKGYNATNFDKKEIAQNKNLQPDFDRVEDDTSFPHEDLEVMQETLRSTPVNDLSELAKKTNLVPLGFEPMEDVPLIPREKLK
ncbi:hypothetical protein HAX54_002201 [Datura stramonium]|uniref:Uncharacterized protein n=1 Tax=Datura stramonium TaxID=4076 RepID=A0ABS8RSU4_DATST|nr:hypothetical protein [Datura stramonium]